MFGSFPRLGGKGRDVQGLLKNSISLLGRDIDVFKPAIYMTLIKSIRIIITLFTLYFFFISKNSELGLLFLFLLIILSPIISYLNMRYNAVTSWMIYDVLRGKDTDVSIGSKELKGVGFTIFLYSIIDYIVQTASKNSKNEKNSILKILKDLILSVFEEVWDLVKHFSIPAIVIDKTSLKEITGKLKLIKKNIPAALTGVLGIDLIGSLFTSLFSFIQLPALLIGGAIGFYGNSFLPVEWLVTLPLETPQEINLLPLFIIFLGSSIFVSFLNSLVQLVKTSYFTTFYISITRPNEIDPSLKKEITNYLNFNDRLDGYKFFKEKTPQAEEGHDLDVDSGEDLQLIKKIANTFKKNIAKGLNEKKIYSALLKKGYSKEQLHSGLEMSRANKG